jgi:arylsulfatase A-like enzyme
MAQWRAADMGLRRAAAEGFVAGFFLAGADLLLSTMLGRDVPALRAALGTLLPLALLTAILFAGARALLALAGRLTRSASGWGHLPLTPLYFLLAYAVAEYYLAGELLSWIDAREGKISLMMPDEPLAEAASLGIAALVAFASFLVRTRGSWRTRISAGALAAFALALLPFILWRGAPPIGARNILLVTVDTLRMDVLGCYGNSEGITPHIDALAREGTLFTNATSQANVTLPSHTSILTSLYLRSHGITHNAVIRRGGTETTLPGILRMNGYRTGAFVHALVLDSRFGLEKDFDVYADTYTEKTFRRMLLMKLGLTGLYARHDHSLALHVNELALPWVIAGGRKPFFAWVHYFDPHEPYNPPEEFRRRFIEGMTSRIDPASFRGSDINEGRLMPGEEDVAFIRGLYRGEVSAVDAAIGELMEALEEKGLLGSTLVIFTADHGEELFDNEQYVGHQKVMYETVLHVPLLLAGPSISAGKIVRTPVETRDIPRTITDWLGLAAAADFEGESLLRGIEREMDRAAGRPVFAEAYSLEGELGSLVIKWDGLKYLEGAEGGTGTLFSLDEGLGEKPLTPLDQAALSRARELRDAWEAAHPAFSGDAAPLLDPETRKALKALGYLQ